MLIKQINKLIDESIKDKPMVVWYDDGATLSNIIKEAIPEGVNFVPFEGSYLAIRLKVEKSDPRLKNKWFIYIGEKRREKSWIRDYELFGECVEYNLERLLVDHFGLRSSREIRELLEGHRGRALADKWDMIIGGIKGSITQERIIDGLLSVTFQILPFDIKRAILEYLTYSERYISELGRMGLHKRFNEKINELLGVSCLKDEIVDPMLLASAFLLSELVESSGGIGEKEFHSLIPSKEKRILAYNLVKDWTHNTALRDGFFRWSEELASKYDVKSKFQGFEKLTEVLSFKDVDAQLLDEIIARIKGGEFEKHAKMIEKVSDKRKKTIWSETGRIKFWDYIYHAARLNNLIHENTELLEEKDLSMDEFIENYIHRWWIIDESYLNLASNAIAPDERINEYILKPSSERYGKWLEFLGKRFSEAVSQAGRWKSKHAYSQKKFWEKNISVDDKRVAILYIDALRYDLAKHLITKINERGFEVSSIPMLSSIPSITEVGMAALLPKHEDNISLIVENGDIKIAIDEFLVTQKGDRNEWIKKIFPDSVFLDLSEICSSTNEKLRQKIGKASRIFILDRKIDVLGTFITDISVSFFNDAIEKIAAAIENLHYAGIKKVVIGTDHGFLLLPEGMKTDTIQNISVSSETCKSWRFLAGKPPKVESLLTFDYKELGFSSQGFARFPRAIGCIAMPGRMVFYHGGISLQENCLLSITSIFEPKDVERVKIKAELPEVISTAVFLVSIAPFFEKLTALQRKVVVQVLSEDKIISESDIHSIFQEPVKARLVLKKIPKKAKIQIKDIETNEILFAKEVQVKLEGYDEFI